MFERGTDGPEVIVPGIDESLRAAAYAAGLARRQRSLLALVHVQPLSLSGTAGLNVPVAEAASQVAEEIIARIREAAERLGDDFTLRWEFRTFPGDPSSGLARVAGDLRAAAVVAGASEQAGRRIIGSLALRLVKAARWPVTVVPQARTRDRRSRDENATGRGQGQGAPGRSPADPAAR